MGRKIAIWKAPCPDCGASIVEVESRLGLADRALCGEGHWSTVSWEPPTVGDLEPRLHLEASQRAA